MDIRSGLRRVKKCCHNYELTKDVLKKIDTMATYENSKTNEEEPSTSGIASLNLINDSSEEDNESYFF